MKGAIHHLAQCTKCNSWSRQRTGKLTVMFSQKVSQKFREDDIEVDRELRSRPIKHHSSKSQTQIKIRRQVPSRDYLPLFSNLQHTHNKSDRLSDACINTRIVLLSPKHMPSPFFCDISGAMSYQNNEADTANLFKEIDHSVDANTSDYTPDNKSH